MREIKFRSWNVEQKIMHSIAMPSWNGTHEVWMGNVPQGVTTWLTNGPEMEGILMQYTGLKDKNGKEIYEGDYIDTEEGLMEVFFIEGKFIIMWADNGTYRNDLCEVNKTLTVCGNKFEKPDR